MMACASRPEPAAARPRGIGRLIQCALTALALIRPLPICAAPVPESQFTLVLYNSADPLSAELADFYAEKRGIPPERRIGLATSSEEIITRAEYEHTIARPLRETFARRGWWEAGALRTTPGRPIRFIALIRGIPLKIRPPDPPPVEPTHTPRPGAPAPSPPPQPTPVSPMDREEASVDSELAALAPLVRSPKGPQSNPYFRSWLRFREGGPADLMLVGRLDGPSGSTVRRMIEDSLATEAAGLRGWACIDARGLSGTSYVQGDDWLRAAADTARARGMPVLFDRREALFAPNFPLPRTALYLGWYTENMAGAVRREDFAFERGAVAIHIHSFSADTLRSPERTWCGPLMLRGAAATLGNVYEPYLDLTPHLDLFAERLLSGLTLAESAWASTKVVSWMTTVIGDPLYRPFAAFADLMPDAPRGAELREWETFAEGSRRWRKDRASATVELAVRGRELRSPLILEGLAQLQLSADDFVGSERSLDTALSLATHPNDRLRLLATQIELLRLAGRNQAALQVVRQHLPDYSSGPNRAYLDSLLLELDPPPPPTSTPLPRK